MIDALGDQNPPGEGSEQADLRGRGRHSRDPIGQFRRGELRREAPGPPVYVRVSAAAPEPAAAQRTKAVAETGWAPNTCFGIGPDQSSGTSPDEA